MRNPATGFLVYADKVDGKLVPTEFIAGRTDVMLLEQAGIQKNLLDDQKPRAQVLAMPAGRADPQCAEDGDDQQPGRLHPVLGPGGVHADVRRQHGRVLQFHRFRREFDGNYYAEASYNQLAISTTFYPGSTPAVYSYQDSYPRAYYMPYDATTNPTGYNGDTERRTREHTLLQNAVNAISAEVPAG